MPGIGYIFHVILRHQSVLSQPYDWSGDIWFLQYLLNKGTTSGIRWKPLGEVQFLGIDLVRQLPGH